MARGESGIDKGMIYNRGGSGIDKGMICFRS